jgi:uncharacterized glyoxalase superfamily protein PhnB
MLRLTPILWVPSIEEAVMFYRRLGFDQIDALTDTSGKLLHAQATRGDVSLMFGDLSAPLAPAHLGHGSPELYISLDAVDEYFDRVRGSGAEITQEPTDQFWGDRTFTIRDPWGHILTFSQTVREFDPARDVPAALPA